MSDYENVLSTKETDDEEEQYIVFQLGEGKYALSSKVVSHIEVLGSVTPIIKADAHCIGVLLFHGESVSVYDLRSMFGIGDASAELENLMQERIQDHETWVAQLERSVQTGEPFTLTTDPHQCAFGKWYDSFQTDNGYLSMFIKNIDAPHKAIHETGAHAKQLMAEGRQEEARELVLHMKGTHFAKTKQLLGEVGRVQKETSRTMLIIINVDGMTKGVVVDTVLGIHPLEETYALPGQLSASERRYISGIAKDVTSQNSDKVIQMVNPESI